MARRFDHLADVEAFLTVVERGSMTEGAVTLSTTPSVVSRAITRLEERLGTQLLRRTTRRLSLTEAGNIYLEQMRIAFSLVDDAERQIRGSSGEVSGQVRLTVPTTYGHYRLPSMLARFREAYPRIQIELSITNRNVDLVAEGFDLAIRLGQLRDSALVARKLEDARLCLVASPEYLRRKGVPQTIEDLSNHDCLPFMMPSTGRDAPWLFRVADENVTWTPSGAVRVLDDVLGAVSLAEGGLGICQTYEFVVAGHVSQGRLREIAIGSDQRTRPFSMLFPPHQRISLATRTLIDFLSATASQRLR